MIFGVKGGRNGGVVGMGVHRLTIHLRYAASSRARSPTFAGASDRIVPTVKNTPRTLTPLLYVALAAFLLAPSTMLGGTVAKHAVNTITELQMDRRRLNIRAGK